GGLLGAERPRGAGGGVPGCVARAAGGRLGRRVRRPPGRARTARGGLRGGDGGPGCPPRRRPRLAGSWQVAPPRRVHQPSPRGDRADRHLRGGRRYDLRPHPPRPPCPPPSPPPPPPPPPRRP